MTSCIDFGGSRFAQRYSTLTAITPNNAQRLRPAWETTLGEPPGENVGGGLEYGGTYYIQSAQGDVFALDGSAGRTTASAATSRR